MVKIYDHLIDVQKALFLHIWHIFFDISIINLHNITNNEKKKKNSDWKAVWKIENSLNLENF